MNTKFLEDEANEKFDKVMRYIVSVLFLAMLQLSASAQLPPQPFKPWQFWQGKTKLGNPQCTLYAAAPLIQNSNDNLVSLSIDHFGNDEFLRVSIFHNELTLDSHRDIPVSVAFTDKSPLILIGVVDGKFVDINIPKELKEVFLSPFSTGSTMKIILNSDAKKEFSVSLKSAKNLLKKFVSCSVGAAQEKNMSNKINAKKSCEKIRLTGIAAAKITDLEEALQAKDQPVYVAQYPILCNSNNMCTGVAWFANQKGINKSSSDDGLMWVEIPLDLTAGRRDVHLVTRNSSVACVN